MTKRKEIPEWQQPLMPVDYLRVVLEIARERGVDEAPLLAAAGLEASLVDDLDARIPHLSYALLVLKLIETTGDEGIGTEIGLRLGPTAHGALGHAIMCCATLGEAILLAERFRQTRMIGIGVSHRIEGDALVADFRASWSQMGRLGHVFFEGTMAALYRSVQILLGDYSRFGEVWFDYPEPPYFARFRDRLPPARFDMPVCSLRLPRSFLERPLIMPNATALKLALLQCERELALVGDAGEDWLARVQAQLVAGRDGYPALTVIAARLHISERTLKRKLADSGSGYKELLQAARRRDALRLLANSALDIQRIAELLGYTNPANFTRAFQAWTGTTPSRYRAAGPARES